MTDEKKWEVYCNYLSKVYFDPAEGEFEALLESLLKDLEVPLAKVDQFIESME